MKTFTLNSGNTYTQQDNGYCFAIIDGKKTRCSAASFKMSHDQFVKEENERQNAANEFTNIEPLTEAEFEAAVQEAEESAETEEAKEIADLYCRHPEGTDLQKPAVLNQHGCVDCSKCNVQDCVHRDCMRRNPTSEGGLAECPRLKVKAEEPKAKKARRSKDVAFEYRYNTIDDPEGEMITLTTKQVDFLHEMVNTMAWDGFDHPLYIDLLVDEIGGQFAGKPMTVGAMISTICEKGLGERETARRDNHKCTTFTFSPKGVAVSGALGL